MTLSFLKKFEIAKSKELIGVDIGSTSLKVCSLKSSKDGFTINCVDRTTFEDDLLSDGYIINSDVIASELKNLVQRNGLKSKDAACALSSYSVISKKVVLPLLDEASLENSISVEVESVIPFPLKDIYYSYFVTGTDEEKENMMNVQIVAAKKEIIDGYLKTFDAAGLRLQLLDVDIFCITNLVESIYRPKDSSVVVADIGSSVTKLAIMKGENIEFTREILVGGKYLTSQIEKASKLSYREAEEKKVRGGSEILYLYEDFIFNISSEINKTVNFYTSTKTREKIGRIYLTGGASLLQGLKERIEENTKIPVEHINPFRFVRDSEEAWQVYKDSKEFIGIALYLSSRVGDVMS
jgi:type IV pilus assembly protein PilM